MLLKIFYGWGLRSSVLVSTNSESREAEKSYLAETLNEKMWTPMTNSSSPTQIYHSKVEVKLLKYLLIYIKCLRWVDQSRKWPDIPLDKTIFNWLLFGAAPCGEKKSNNYANDPFHHNQAQSTYAHVLHLTNEKVGKVRKKTHSSKNRLSWEK